jgi:3-hydroxymyristoyl/3-hydroxydecanoyl-(acyl carrier protein) dehydratase
VRIALPRQVTGRTGFPFVMIDCVLDVTPGRRGRGRKLATANEPYFSGHFPDVPVMPGVLLCESLAQLGAVVVDDGGAPMGLAGVARARFRRPVEPGDALDLEVEVVGGGPPWAMRGTVRVDRTVAAEVEFSLAPPPGAWVHPTAIVHRGAEIAPGVIVEANATIGPDVRIGEGSWIGPAAVVTGRTTLGARNRIFPFATIGLPPQDLKYRGEPSTVVIGDDNTMREFVSVNPGTEGGGSRRASGAGACSWCTPTSVTTVASVTGSCSPIPSPLPVTCTWKITRSSGAWRACTSSPAWASLPSARPGPWFRSTCRRSARPRAIGRGSSG